LFFALSTLPAISLSLWVLREELKVVTDALEFEVNEGGGCDHETGICWCPVLKKIRHAKSALERNEDNE